MKDTKRFLFVLSAILLTATLSCSSSEKETVVMESITPGEYSYLTSVSTHRFSHPMDRCFQSSLEALEMLGLEILESNSDALVGTIKARFSDLKEMEISLEAISEKVTEVRVDTGYMGTKANKRKATRIMRTINSLLNPPSP